MRLKLKIINLLSDKKRLTINQIAIRLNESYSFVNRTVNKMLADNLLLKEKIGHSFLCSLNIKNDKTKILMSLNEVNKKQEFLKKNKELKLITDEILNKIKNKAISAAIFGSYAKNVQTKQSDIDIFILAKKIFSVTELVKDIYSRYGKEVSPIVITEKQLKSRKNKPIITEIAKYHIILIGFENFINIMFENETQGDYNKGF
jgi:predicted nucleotidyltransferase